jgi:hypothetical protein
MMNDKLFQTNLDLKPWAAFVIGHHPYTLRLRQEWLWESLYWESPWEIPQLGAPQWDPRLTDIEELRDALELLALHEDVRAAALVELHRASDAFTSIYLPLGEHREPSPDDEEKPDPTAPGLGRAPAYPEWCRMIAFAARVVGPSNVLQRWRELGARVGCGLYKLRGSATLPSASPRPGELASIAGKFECEGNPPLGELVMLLSEIDRWAAAEDGSICWASEDECYLWLSQLDLELQAALRQDPPEPVLILDSHHITFLGIRRELADYRHLKSEIACLWVLALRAGAWVTRTDLITRAGIQTDEINLKFVMSHLRTKVLKPLAEEHYQDTNCDPPPELERVFILGERGGLHGGPYRLDLDPALVRVSAPRPSWG